MNDPVEESVLGGRRWGCGGIWSRRAGRGCRSIGGTGDTASSSIVHGQEIGLSINVPAGREKTGKRAPKVIVSRPSKGKRQMEERMEVGR